MKWGIGAFVIFVYYAVWSLCKAASKGEKDYSDY